MAFWYLLIVRSSLSVSPMELIRNEALEHDTPMILLHIAPETPAADQKIPFPTFHEVFLCSPHKTCLLSVALFLPSFALSIPWQTSQTNTFDCAKYPPYLLTKDPVGYYSKRPDTCTTAASNAFWQNAELIPSGRMAFFKLSHLGIFLIILYRWSTISGFFSNRSMSRLMRAVYEFCICC